MKVRLISYSKPVDMIGIDNAEDLVAYCARVSNPFFPSKHRRRDVFELGAGGRTDTHVR